MSIICNKNTTTIFEFFNKYGKKIVLEENSRVEFKLDAEKIKEEENSTELRDLINPKNIVTGIIIDYYKGIDYIKLQNDNKQIVYLPLRFVEDIII